MDGNELDTVVRSIDARLERVEQILPTLATKAELGDTASVLATKAELREAVSVLATKVELYEEGQRTRRHFDIVAERLEGHIRLLAEGQVALRESMDLQFEAVRTSIVQLDRRVMRLEAAWHP
jgi:hypothetical protein